MAIRTFEVSRLSVVMTLTALRAVKLPNAFLLGKVEKFLETYLKEFDEPYFKITIEGSLTGKD